MISLSLLKEKILEIDVSDTFGQFINSLNCFEIIRKSKRKI
jgi:hypothetical protein